MIDVDKVIKGLECCTRDIRSQDDNPCNGCPYDVNYQNNNSTCTLDLKKDTLALLKAQEPETMDAPKPDSDIGCWYDITHNYTLEQVVSALKEQEPPTSGFISSAIECLLHPEDADESDMAKAIDTAVRAMRLLKAQEPKMVQVIGTVGVSNVQFANCPWCSMRIHDDESKKYCGHCGKAVKWE